MCSPENLSQERREISAGECHGTDASFSCLLFNENGAGMVPFSCGYHATLGGLGPSPTIGQ